MRYLASVAQGFLPRVAPGGCAASIDPKIQSDLWAYMGGIVREIRGTARLINGVENHVHILLSLPGDISVADCLQVVKTNSSRWINETHHSGFAWQTGYGAFSVSASHEKQVFKYIQDQERHHRKMTFEEEFISLLRKHNISFDERFPWK